MRPATATLGTVFAAAMLTLAQPLTALGATGRFTYTEAGTHQIKTIDNPALDVCNKVAGDGATRNQTDARAYLYFQSADCSGPSHDLDPGQGPQGFSFQSVEFVVCPRTNPHCPQR